MKNLSWKLDIGVKQDIGDKCYAYGFAQSFLDDVTRPLSTSVYNGVDVKVKDPVVGSLRENS